MKKLLSFICIAHANISYAIAADVQGTHGDGHHESVVGLPQLDSSTYASQAFWLVISFIALYIVFAKKSIPAISQTIETRAERIKNDLSSAEQVKADVEKVQKSYEESLSAARHESSQVFANIESEIKEKSQTHAKEFAERSSRQIFELEKNIDIARKKAMAEMNDVAADIAALAAEKIIGVRMDAKSVKSILNSDKAA